MGKKKVMNSLQDLQGLLSPEEQEELKRQELVRLEEERVEKLRRKEEKERQEKIEYQKKWDENKYNFRKMIAPKNRKWLKEEAKNCDFEYYKEFPDVYRKIKEAFDSDTKRNWMLHIMCNFLPLNKSQQVPRLAKDKKVCPFGGFELTDVNSILTGDRDKHIAFTGESTNVVLSGIALQELERFVIDCTDDFDSRIGQIVNYALDGVRTNNKFKRNGEAK